MKRLPIIRHIRYFILRYRVNRHYEFYRSLGMHSGNAKHDYATLDEIWNGNL